VTGLTRRALLTMAFWRAPAASERHRPRPADAIDGDPSPMPSRRHAAPPLLRPPGAIAEDAFLAGCTKCDACAQACPHDAIFKAGDRFRTAAGTPILDPALSACQLCADRPCITACPEGVLRADLPTAIGTALIVQGDCLAHRGSFCSTCIERCPVPGAIATTHGRPSVVADLCNGCGICQFMCPAPINAIHILPNRARPNVPALPRQDRENAQ